jgi:hypothetical protein
MEKRKGEAKMRHTIFLFGEAEKGDFCTPYLCKSLPHLADTFGNPPDESLGLMYAVQALMYDRTLIYYRVKEEGFSVQDYLRGIRLLENKEIFHGLTAICMPGVGDSEIIEATSPICSMHRSLLITSEKDLYDFLTACKN